MMIGSHLRRSGPFPVLLALFAAIGLLASPAPAQTWPTARPIKMIIPFPPGGAADVTGRLFADALARQLNQTFVVENVAGAAGNIGATAAARSTPDGYTILFGADPIVGTPFVSKVSYDAIKDFTPVIHLTRQPIVLAVHPGTGIGGLADLVAQAKSGKQLTFGTTGAGTSQHLVAEWFARRAGIAMTHVPYRGGAPALNDAVAGHISMIVLGATPIIPHHKAGTLRAIGQSSRERAKSLPDVPTFKEAGFADIEYDQWFAVLVPAGTPADIVSRLNSEFRKALADPDVIARLAQHAQEPTGGSSKDLAAIMTAESEKYARLVKELGLAAQE
jgi:tripartite-type tricarboxylate transporter receptor subunit TctC